VRLAPNIAAWDFTKLWSYPSAPVSREGAEERGSATRSGMQLPIHTKIIRDLALNQLAALTEPRSEIWATRPLINFPSKAKTLETCHLVSTKTFNLMKRRGNKFLEARSSRKTDGKRWPEFAIRPPT